jgi:hypothetical protein
LAAESSQSNDLARVKSLSVSCRPVAAVQQE